MIRILDVSEFQGQVDWPKVAAAGIGAGIHKATQYRLDYQHAANHRGIPDAGLPHGCYHFLVSDVAVADQATLYVGATGEFGTGDFPPVIDFEKYNGRLPTPDQLDSFLGLLAPHSSRRPLLYGNAGDLATLGTQFVGRVDVWLADYGPNTGQPNGDPNAKRASTQFPPADVKLWQYTSRGQVDGVYALCDLSMWLGTQAELDAYVNPQPVVQPQGQEEPDMASCTDPKNGCHTLADQSGAAFAFNADGTPGGHYLGGANGRDWGVGPGQPNGPVVAIEPWDDGNPALSGYVMWTKDAAGAFHRYAFPSSGVLAK